MPRTLVLISCLLLWVSACCPLISVHPLGAPHQTECDSRLEGVWRQDFEKDYVVLHIGKAPDGRIQVIVVEHDEGGKVDYDGFTVSAVRLKGRYYLDIDTAELTPAHREGQQGHVIIAYSLPDDNTLVIGSLELEPVAAAVQSKKLAGEITYRKTAQPPGKKPEAGKAPEIECATITDTSDHLAQFIAASDPERLFKTAGTFKRMPR